MKKVFFALAMLFVAGLTFAQVKNVKDARAIANEMKPDFAKAESLIQAALENPETKDDAETWNVAGLIQKKRSEKEMLDSLMSKYPDLEWNFDNDNFDILNRADLLISDFSGVIFDFALVFGAEPLSPKIEAATPLSISISSVESDETISLRLSGISIFIPP